MIGRWIIDQFSEHVCYVEPFGGGASVLLKKEPSKIEVYNDLNKLVVNFFQVLRDQTDELIRKIKLTPYSREEYRLAQQLCDDPVEQARRFYVWSWLGRGRAGVEEPAGWRFLVRDSRRNNTYTKDWNNCDHLWDVARRLMMVQIECDDALRVIKRFDSERTLFYIDPPYLQETRCSRWKKAAYKFEYSREEHVILAGLLNSVKGKVIISGYQSKLYNDLYRGWKRIDHAGINDNSANRKTTEVLWIS